LPLTRPAPQIGLESRVCSCRRGMSAVAVPDRRPRPHRTDPKTGWADCRTPLGTQSRVRVEVHRTVVRR
jgi:hypothetical protein